MIKTFITKIYFAVNFYCALFVCLSFCPLSLFLLQSHRISFSMSMFERRTFVQIKSIFISLNDSNLRLEVRRLGTKLTFIYHKHFDVNKHLNSTVYLPCGYGRRFVFQKSWVQIPAPDTRWIFFTLIWCKTCIVCLKKTENERKRGRNVPFCVKMSPYFSLKRRRFKRLF